MTEKRVKSKTILIVDDTPVNIELLSAMLSEEYVIRSATCGKEALEIARATRPDIILLDILMPEMNGYDVCKALKADVVTQLIPVFFVSTLLNPGDDTRGFEVGGIDYLTKPVFGAVLRARVKSHLAMQDARHFDEGVLGERSNNDWNDSHT